MQDLRSMTSGGGSRIFGGTGGERRLRPYANQSLKCPRCDSLNTKFCYYNNYNLSQPRHFCKSCQRYWTKGGILRNVPVGGGCRKTKRSKPARRKDRKSTSHSSSENSSLIATTTITATEDASNLPADSRIFVSQSAIINPNSSTVETLEQVPDGSFTSLMMESNPAMLGLNFLGTSSPFQFHQQQLQQHKTAGMVDELKIQEFTATCVDQKVSVDLPGFDQSHNRTSDQDLPAFDCQLISNDDQGWFDLSSTFDQGYLSQSQYWTHHDQPFYLP